MKSFDFAKSFVVAVAAAGAVLPAGVVSAAPPVAATAPASPVTDVALAGGHLNGRVVDAQGVSLNGAMVVVRQNGQEVARTTSDRNGQFSVGGLKGGVYNVSAGNSEGTYRVWTERTAPPAAKNGVVMVSSASPVRSQGPGMGWGTATAIGLGALGTTLGGVALYEANNNDNDAPKTP